MNKSVLISIRPKWIEKIARGEKTIEVRKSRPKLDPPFKCYIYCTHSTDHPCGYIGCYDHDWHTFGLISPLNIEAGKHFNIEVVSGKVVGEFTCDAILPIIVFDNGSIQNWNFWSLNESCISYEDMADYIGRGKQGYGWRIADCKIYHEPKGLSSFASPDLISAWEEYAACEERFGTLMDVVPPDRFHYRIKRPPQSWCYVV